MKSFVKGIADNIGANSQCAGGHSEEVMEDSDVEDLRIEVGEEATGASSKGETMSKIPEPAELCTKGLIDMPYLDVPRGMVKPVLDNLVEANISYKVTTAVACLCDDDECDLSLRIGRYVSLGKGS